MVMELCKGGELFDSMVDYNSFTEDEIKKIIKQLLSALQHLHDLKIIHRDLKPQNILIEQGENMNIKLIDFGMSKICADKNAKLKTLMGTPFYVAPEVLRGEYGFESDLWSVGVIAFHLLTGEPPFLSNN